MMVGGRLRPQVAVNNADGVLRFHARSNKVEPINHTMAAAETAGLSQLVE